MEGEVTPMSTLTPTPGGSSFESGGVELEAILHVLFPPSNIGRDDKGTETTLGPDELAYLSRLGAQGLESLMGEVARVNEELAIIEHQTRDMASQNYQIFVQSAQTTNLIKKSLSEAKASVETLSSTSFPSFCKKTQEFGVPSAKFQKELESLGALEERLEGVGQVLDMPWVLRRCLAAADDKMLPEAIKILHIVMDYKKSVGEGNNEEKMPSALAETIKSVLELQTQIQSALLSKLSSPSITLSECLQTIQLLRNFFPSEKGLRLRFLQSRSTGPVSSSSFEGSRPWLFDSLTQHRAAFGGDSAHLLATFIALQVQGVVGAEVQRALETAPSLHTLFSNATYFGESLARVGADLRGLVVPIFAEFILKRASHELLSAEMNFTKQLHAFNLTTCLIQQRVDQLGLGAEDPSTDELPKSEEGDLRPPAQLLGFHPLAVYLNEVLTLLNFVGRLPLPQLSLELSRRLRGSVGKVGKELEGWGAAEFLTWDPREQALFGRMRSMFEQLLVTHVDKAFRSIFPPQPLSTVTGLSVGKCAELLEISYQREHVA